MNFVHLRLHSEYSLRDSVVRVKPLAQRLQALQQPACALTDHNNVFAMVKFFSACTKAGIKPIAGVDLSVLADDDSGAIDLLTLWCMNERGYQNMVSLISRAFLEGQTQHGACVQKHWITKALGKDLIAMATSRGSDVSRALEAQKEGLAKSRVQHWQSIFDERFCLEVTRLGRPADEVRTSQTALLAEKHGVPLIASADVRFLSAQDFEAHEARVCINRGETLAHRRNEARYTDQQYLCTVEEMQERFHDLPEALSNTVAVAERCSFSFSTGKILLPAFPVPEKISEDDYLKRLSEEGLKKHIAEHDLEPGPYRERLATELAVITKMGFAGYFLIVADFIRWAREQGIPVGPGRGSGAGSLVAFCLKITQIDPLPFSLLFERFLNPERVSMPDFDIDFCMLQRDRVIEYVGERYGRDRVSQIITFGTLAAKAVIRDVGRVLSYPYGFVDSVAKLVPFEVGMTLEKALKDSDELSQRYSDEDDVRTLIDLAKRLEGLSRNAGKHAGGVVISSDPLQCLVPSYRDQEDTPVTQFDKDDVEAIGLVKFDFLGLRTLTIIDHSVRAINKRFPEANINIDKIALNDEATFRMLKTCRTRAVFQLESRGMRDLVERLQPDNFEDIVALVALFRPGPLQSGMVDDFILRKHGKAPIEYQHPSMTETLKPTYGVILYQEQVMKIAQELAGYSLGSADILRRAMGKKKADEMAHQRSIFTDGAIERGISKVIAGQIFDIMEKFAGYGFNKSHSVAYALLSYQTAWLKTHYTDDFMAAVMSADLDHTDKNVDMIEECQDLGIKVLPPSVNESQRIFTVEKPGHIRFGLAAVKGVGESIANDIVAERESAGPYKTVEDFAYRLGTKKLNKRVLDALVRAGALDGLGAERGTIFESIPLVIRSADQHGRDQAIGQSVLFGDSGSTANLDLSHPPALWTIVDQLKGERETLGIFFSGHPYHLYKQELTILVNSNLASIHNSAKGSTGKRRGRQPGRDVIVAGVINKISKRNNRLNLTLDDCSAKLDIVAFSDLASTLVTPLRLDEPIVVEGSLRYDDFQKAWNVIAQKIERLSDLRARRAKNLVVDWCNSEPLLPEFLSQLRLALDGHRPGGCKVRLRYQTAEGTAALKLADEWAVLLSDELVVKLKRLAGDESVRVQYSQ